MGGFIATFVACGGSDEKSGGDDDDAGESGESGSAGRAGGAGGRAGSAGTSGRGGRGGSGSGGDSGEAGEDGSGGSSVAGNDDSGGDGAGGSSAGTAGGGGTAGTLDPCADIDCSGHGECVAGPASARCDCDEGYAPVGLECVSCPSVSGTFDVDVPLVTISGTITVNGETPVTTGTAIIRFYSKEAGEWTGDVVVGSVGSEYEIDIVPGTYDIQYSLQTDGEGLPDNPGAVLRTDVEFDESGTLDIDVPMVTVTGSIEVNGETASPATTPSLRFFGEEAGVTTVVTTGFESYSIELVPGTYDVIYSGSPATGSGAPRNVFATILDDVAIEDDRSLDIDIPMVTLTGDISVNGDSVSTSTMTYLQLAGEGSDTVEVGDVNAGSYSISIVPGTYDVVYWSIGELGVLPGNAYATIREGVDIDDAGTLDIDVPMVTITGNVTVNGEPVPVGSNMGLLSLINAAGDSVSLTDTGSEAYSASLVPGTYSLFYTAQSFETDGIPDNQAAILRTDIEIDEDGTLDLDIPMATLSGDVTIGGDEPAEGALATVYFTNDERGDSVIAAALDAGDTYTAEFVPGSYIGFYNAQLFDGSLPMNTGAEIIESLVVDDDATLDIDIPLGVTLEGDILVNGEAAPGDGDGEIELRRDLSNSLRLGDLATGSYSLRLLPGTYTMYYHVTNALPGVPNNNYVPVGCVQVE